MQANALIKYSNNTLCVLVENLGDDLPLTVNLDESEEVGVVGTRGVTFHVDADDGGSLSDSKHIVAGLDAGGAAKVTNIGEEVANGACEHIGLRRVDEAVHDGVLVERLGNSFGTARAQALSVLVGCLDHGIELGCRNGLDVGRHFLNLEVRERSLVTGHGDGMGTYE